MDNLFADCTFIVIVIDKIVDACSMQRYIHVLLYPCSVLIIHVLFLISKVQHFKTTAVGLLVGILMHKTIHPNRPQCLLHFYPMDSFP